MLSAPVCWPSTVDTVAAAADAAELLGAPGTSDASLTDFNHALAVQATPDQASHFLALTKSTEAARKQAQELLRLSREGR